MQTSIPNILAQRYASKDLLAIWSVPGKILQERKLWVCVLRAQQELGLPIPNEAILDYEKALNIIDLKRINEIEQSTKHDVKARLEAFCEVAGHQLIHRGMTSRDLTENVEQVQIFRSLNIIREKAFAALARLCKACELYKETPITARTHNVPAQLTTLGRRFSMFAEELLLHLKSLDYLIDHYPIRGIKGAVGTQSDMLALLGNDPSKADELDKKILKHLGLPVTLHNTGQIYPRSQDAQVLHVLNQIAAPITNCSNTLRLMAGHAFIHEGMTDGQVGSSAMPHKINCKNAERVRGLSIVLQGYLAMVNQLASLQWNEGDVACSVVRRVALPDSFFAIDGLLGTFIHIMDHLKVHTHLLEQEVECYLPFLLTGILMMEATQNGLGREEAHSIIKKHAHSILDQEGSINKKASKAFCELITNDRKLNISEEKLYALLNNKNLLTSNAVKQVEHLLQEAQPLLAAHPKAQYYEPECLV